MKIYLTLTSLALLTACVNQNQLGYEGGNCVNASGYDVDATDFGVANGGYGTGYTAVLNETESTDPTPEGGENSGDLSCN